MDDQQLHDEQMMSIDLDDFPSKGSRERLEALLKKKNADSLDQLPPVMSGSINQLLMDNPGLTPDEAAEMIEAYGF